MSGLGMEDDSESEACFQEVDSLRSAQLRAEHYRFQLQLAREELRGKAAALGELQAQVSAILSQAVEVRCAEARAGAAPSRQCSEGSEATAEAVFGVEQDFLAKVEELREARLDAEGQRYRASVAELELSRQLGAVQEMQWRLDCLLDQLGLACRQEEEQGPGGQSAGEEDAGVAGSSPTEKVAAVWGSGQEGRSEEVQQLQELLAQVEALRRAKSEAPSLQLRLRASEQREECLRRRVAELEPAAERRASLAAGAAAGAGSSGSRVAPQQGARQLVETRDRRLAQLDADKAGLAAELEAVRAEAEAARAEAEAARREAAVQRRLAKRLQSRPADARPGDAQMVGLLQKRVKVLEAQVIRLRLAASSAAEDAALAAEEAASGGAAAENVPANGQAKGEEEANPVVLKWEADKRLQRKVEALAAKLKEKAASLQAALEARSRLEGELEAARAELGQSQAACRELTAEAARRGAAGDAVPAARVQALLGELDDLQGRHDAVQRQLALLQRGASGGPASPGAGSPVRAEAGGGKAYDPAAYGGTAEAGHGPGELLRKDVQLLELTLERDQQAAHVARLQRRLRELLSCVGSRAGQAGKSAGAPGARAAGPSVREQELLETVTLLRSALERTKKGLASGVSSSRYMAAVERAKQLKARIEDLESADQAAAEAREELASAHKQLGQLQGVVAALRSQLRAARRQRRDADGAREEAVNGQLAELERAVQERDAELEAVQAVHTGAYGQEVAALRAAGLRPRALVQELLHLRPRLRELESENEALRQEVCAVEESALVQLQRLQEAAVAGQQQGWEAEHRAQRVAVGDAPGSVADTAAGSSASSPRLPVTDIKFHQ